MKNLKEQFYDRCMMPKRWCDKHGYTYNTWRQISSGMMTAKRGEAKKMREHMEREGFDFAYLDSEENIAKRRAKYEHNIQRAG